MLGWMISVNRQKDGGLSPAKARPQCGDLLAVWQADIKGLDWINELVEHGEAISLGGNGYPTLYTAPAKCLLPSLQPSPPMAREHWGYPEGSTFSGEPSKTRIHLEAIADCHPDEWLIVQAWDES